MDVRTVDTYTDTGVARHRLTLILTLILILILILILTYSMTHRHLQGPGRKFVFTHIAQSVQANRHDIQRHDSDHANFHSARERQPRAASI